MSPNMEPGRPREESPQVDDADVINYLAAMQPGLMTASSDMIEGARAHLKKEVDAGRLTRRDLDGYKEAAEKMGPYLD